jgi:hypothetical protein
MEEVEVAEAMLGQLIGQTVAPQGDAQTEQPACDVSQNKRGRPVGLAKGYGGSVGLNALPGEGDRPYRGVRGGHKSNQLYDDEARLKNEPLLGLLLKICEVIKNTLGIVIRISVRFFFQRQST